MNENESIKYLSSSLEQTIISPCKTACARNKECTRESVGVGSIQNRFTVKNLPILFILDESWFTWGPGSQRKVSINQVVAFVNVNLTDTVVNKT